MLGNGSILIVLGQPAEAHALSKLLAVMGHPTMIAHSTSEAWEQLGDEHNFSMALVDVDMPGIDGLEFNLALRQKFPRLRVVMVSEFPVADDDAALAFSVLRKPIGRQALEQEISRAVVASLPD